ncbi:MAG: carboxypeptidase regulatory-like domain-containing protein [Blastocatellia bacterium]
MKTITAIFCCFLFVWFVPQSARATAPLPWLNRIEGQVYDPSRRPVENVHVELLNEVETMVAYTKTNSAGRFTFTGMNAGRYYVKVMPLGTNMMEQTQEVSITNATRGANDTVYVDVHLRYDPRNRGVTTEAPREVVFVQDIPAAAKKLYEDGIADLPKNQERGLARLEDAIKIFPEYFDALHRLGKEYVSHNQYEKGYPYLMRAIDVNGRSYSSYYSLAYAFYQLKQYPAAAEAARATTVLSPDTMEAHLLYGTVLRINGSYSEAEKALGKANTLAKKMNGEVHWQLALLFNRLNRNQETIEELETYLKLVPNSPDKKKIEEMLAKLKTSPNKK